MKKHIKPISILLSALIFMSIFSVLTVGASGATYAVDKITGSTKES